MDSSSPSPAPNSWGWGLAGSRSENRGLGPCWQQEWEQAEGNCCHMGASQSL